MKRKRFIKSNDEFVIDEELVDEISNADEFADLELSKEDIIEAVEAINDIANAIIEENPAIVDGDVLSVVADKVGDEEVVEYFEIEEDEELPEELTNSVVKVMVADDTDVEVEVNNDEVYNTEIDGEQAIAFDTIVDYPVELEEYDEVGGELLVVGNSKTKNFRKGVLRLSSSKNKNKRAWSSAVRKVKKLIKNNQLKAVHWAIVSMLCTKFTEQLKRKQKIKSRLVKFVKNNTKLNTKLIKIIKSSQEELDNDGVTNVNPETSYGFANGYGEKKPTIEKADSPEEVTSDFSDDTTQFKGEEALTEVPDAPIEELEIPLNNNRKIKVKLQRLESNKRMGYAIYKVVPVFDRPRAMTNGRRFSERLQSSNRPMIRQSRREIRRPNVENTFATMKLHNALLNCGKVAFLFKNTSQGLLACCAKRLESGKGRYNTVIKNGVVCIARGKEYPIFLSVEKRLVDRAVTNARQMGERIGERKSKAIFESRLADTKRYSDTQIRRARTLASAGEKRLKDIHAQEERERLFQNSQAQITKEQDEIKIANRRNESTLDKMYNGLF